MTDCNIVGRRKKYKLKSEGVNYKVWGSFKFKPFTLNSRVFSPFRIPPQGAHSGIYTCTYFSSSCVKIYIFFFI